MPDTRIDAGVDIRGSNAIERVIVARRGGEMIDSVGNDRTLAATRRTGGVRLTGPIDTAAGGME